MIKTIQHLAEADSSRVLVALDLKAVFAPSRRHRTIQTIHGVVSHSGVFPGFFHDRLLEFSLLRSRSPPEGQFLLLEDSNFFRVLRRHEVAFVFVHRFSFSQQVLPENLDLLVSQLSKFLFAL